MKDKIKKIAGSFDFKYILKLFFGKINSQFIIYNKDVIYCNNIKNL